MNQRQPLRKQLAEFTEGLHEAPRETLLIASKETFDRRAVNRRLKLLESITAQAKAIDAGVFADATARFVIAHREHIQPMRITRLLNNIARMYVEPNPPSGLHGEANFFMIAELPEYVPENVLRTRLKRWVHNRFQTLKDRELQSFAESLPKEIAWYPDWRFDFFKLAFQKNLDPISLGILPNITSDSIGKRKNFVALWITLWFAGLYEQLAWDAEIVANATGKPDDRFFQVRGLAMSRQFGRAREFLSHPEIVNADKRKRIDFGKTLFSNCVIGTRNDPKARLEFLQLLTLLPVTNRNNVAQKFRGACRLLHRENDSFEERAIAARRIMSIPARLDFDLGWPVFRLSLLSHAGYFKQPEEFIDAVNALPDEQYELTDIASVCNLLHRRDCKELLGTWVQRGVLSGTHPRLQRFHTEQLLKEQNYEEAVEAALRFVLISLHSRDSSAKSLGLFREASIQLREQPGHDKTIVAENAIDRLRCMPRVRAREPLATLIEIFLALHDGNRDLAISILQSFAHSNPDDTALHETFLAGLKSICDGATHLSLLEEISSKLTLASWLHHFAVVLHANGSLQQTLESLERALDLEPDHEKSICLKIRVLSSLNQNESARELCDEILEKNPRNVEVLRLRLAVDRATKVDESEVLTRIEQSLAAWNSPARQRALRVNFLQVASLTHRAFLESWNWFNDEAESPQAALQLGKSLRTMGEFGAAEFFLQTRARKNGGDQFVDQSLNYFQSVRSLLDKDPLDAKAAHSRCAAIADEVKAGALFLASDSTEQASSSIRAPECFCGFLSQQIHAHRIAITDRSFDGPICIVSSSLGPGGAERQVVYTATGLEQQLGYDKLVVLCGNLGEHRNTSFFLPQLKEAGVPVFTADMNRPKPELPQFDRGEIVAPDRLVERVLQLWPENQGRRYVSAYHRFFEEHRPRVVHAWQDETSVLAGIAALLAGVPKIVLSGRSLSPLYRPTKPTYLRAAYRFLAQYDHVLMTNNSAAGAKDYANWIGNVRHDIAVIHNGFDFAEIDKRLRSKSPEVLRAELEIPDAAVLIGAVLRMNEVKRPDLCLDIMLELLDIIPNSYAMIVGGGPTFQQVSSRGLNSKHAARLRFPGSVYPVEPWMAAMDINLLTSRVEGLPNVLVEAQAVGTPVASTNVGGAAETFVDGESGILLDTSDPTACARQIAEFLQNADGLSAAEFGREYVRRNFSIEGMIKRTREILGV